MALPSNTDLQTLDVAYLGQPFVQVEAKSLTTTSLDTVYFAQPFVGAAAAAVAAGLNVYVKISGVWKQASAMFVRASGVWKSVTTVSTRQSGVWKS